MRYPKVNIILAVKNEGDFIAETLSDLLNQTYPNKDIVVYNDGSSDKTAQILEDFGSSITYKSNEVNRGQSFCINRVLEETNATYVAIADGDDRYHQAKLSKQIAFMEKNPQIGVCGCMLSTIPTGMHWDLPVKNEQIKARMLLNMPMAHPTLVYRKNALANLWYDESLSQAKDYDFLSRLRHKTQFHTLPFYGIQYRMNKADKESVVMRKANANQIRARILNEDFGIKDSEFVELHNVICNLEQGAESMNLNTWIELLLRQNSVCDGKALRRELYTQLWRYTHKFNLGKKDEFQFLIKSSLPTGQKAKAWFKLLQ